MEFLGIFFRHSDIVGILISAVFGAIFGSYATLFAYRLPINESCFGRYFGQKSRCPNCGTTIITRDLIPVINWLFTLGRCRSCSTKIPRTHLFIELSTTILFVISYLKFSFSEEFIIYALMSVAFVVLLVTDFTHRVFPTAVLNFILLLAVAVRAMHDQSIIDMVFSGTIGVLFAIIFYQIFFKRTQGLFSDQKHSFDYTKIILIAGVCFKPLTLVFYFFLVMSILTAFLLFDVPNRANRNNFGYVLIVPFLWLIFCLPSFL